MRSRDLVAFLWEFDPHFYGTYTDTRCGTRRYSQLSLKWVPSMSWRARQGNLLWADYLDCTPAKSEHGEAGCSSPAARRVDRHVALYFCAWEVGGGV